MNPLWILGLFMLIIGVLVPPLGLLLLIVFGPIVLLMAIMVPGSLGDWNKL